MKTSDVMILAGAALAAWWILAPSGKVKVGQVQSDPQTPRQLEDWIMGNGGFTNPFTGAAVLPGGGASMDSGGYW